MKIELKILNKEFYAERLLPSYATSGSAGIDLVCTEDVTIYPGETKMISTGLAIWIASNCCFSLSGLETGKENQDKDGYYYEGISIVGLIFPRSGLGTKGLVLANTIGVIDEDYQGELKISAWNRLERVNEAIIGKEFFANRIELKAGDKIAQLLFVPIIKAAWEIVDEFSNSTDRGTGSFGSTGD